MLRGMHAWRCGAAAPRLIARFVQPMTVPTRRRASSGVASPEGPPSPSSSPSPSLRPPPVHAATSAAAADERSSLAAWPITPESTDFAHVPPQGPTTSVHMPAYLDGTVTTGSYASSFRTPGESPIVTRKRKWYAPFGGLSWTVTGVILLGTTLTVIVTNILIVHTKVVQADKLLAQRRRLRKALRAHGLDPDAILHGSP
ncbi:hypothetical protein CXG81DRAFT_20862 [Caulochytrium protostelioides]|uniref:Transmembrane protein n=1 Tax=Caulochytrium protostelioides TaxID=1555241 RepID=A0A4P9X1W3_9FUNG|nr:hypothetical protein CXG81DRAFT_20862 [Caulochytrium protostelioides]|eukprot:RKO98993.1 hypothetical protein CXG81DRAFT_20862 [Caulochytrium protostelioides]